LSLGLTKHNTMKTY